jgi:ribosomal protein S27E
VPRAQRGFFFAEPLHLGA